MHASFGLGLGVGISHRQPRARGARDVARGHRRRHRPGPRRVRRAGRDRQGHHAFLLGRLVELSDGRSLETNLALVRHNARVGTAIAVAYAATA